MFILLITFTLTSFFHLQLYHSFFDIESTFTHSRFKMVYISKIASVVAAAYLAGSVVAHPGEHHDHAEVKRQIRARDQMASAAKRSLDTCSSSLKARELNSRSVARRAEVAREIRAKRNIQNSKSRTNPANSD
jgi:hypothetical protein